MMDHNICFKGGIWKITPKLSLLHILFWSTEGGKNEKGRAPPQESVPLCLHTENIKVKE